MDPYVVILVLLVVGIYIIKLALEGYSPEKARRYRAQRKKELKRLLTAGRHDKKTVLLFAVLVGVLLIISVTTGWLVCKILTWVVAR